MANRLELLEEELTLANTLELLDARILLTLTNELEALLIEEETLLIEDGVLELLIGDELELLLEELDNPWEDGDGFELPPPPPQAVNITEAIAETKKQEGFFFIHRVLVVKGFIH